MTSEWTDGSVTTHTRQQFIALVNNCGVANAKRLMKHVIITRRPTDLDNIPPERLDAWALRAAEGEIIPPKLETAVKKRVMAHEEWEDRRLQARQRATLEKFLDKVDGRLDRGEDIGDDRVFLKYLDDGLYVGRTSIQQVYGTPRAAAMQVGQLVINAGTPPPKRLRTLQRKQLPEPVIDAEFSEVPVGDG